MNEVRETNALTNGPAYHQANADNTHPKTPYIDWTTPGLKITRLRLLTDRCVPFWDVSYCDGVLDGYHVNVLLPFSQLPKGAVTKAIIQYAQRDKVYAKGIGILGCISTLR